MLFYKRHHSLLDILYSPLLIIFVLLGILYSPLVTLSYAQTYGGSYDGYNMSESQIKLFQGGGGSVGMSAAAQVFMVGQSPVAMAPIVIRDAGGDIAAANATGDIRITIPGSLNMTWDTSAATAQLGGGAAGKCSSVVTFEDANKTARIDVTGNFTYGDTLVVAGLVFKGFGSSGGPEYVDVRIYNTSAVQAYDASAGLMIIDSDGAVYTGGSGDGYAFSMTRGYAWGVSQKTTFVGLSGSGFRVE